VEYSFVFDRSSSVFADTERGRLTDDPEFDTVWHEWFFADEDDEKPMVADLGAFGRHGSGLGSNHAARCR
jgi:hypothetical protein